jgi:hypothetical protein
MPIPNTKNSRKRLKVIEFDLKFKILLDFICKSISMAEVLRGDSILCAKEPSKVIHICGALLLDSGTFTSASDTSCTPRK